MVCTLLDIQFKQIVHIFENKNNKQILTKDATQALRKEITRDKMGIAAILKEHFTGIFLVNDFWTPLPPQFSTWISYASH